MPHIQNISQVEDHGAQNTIPHFLQITNERKSCSYYRKSDHRPKRALLPHPMSTGSPKQNLKTEKTQQQIDSKTRSRKSNPQTSRSLTPLKPSPEFRTLERLFLRRSVPHHTIISAFISLLEARAPRVDQPFHTHHIYFNLLSSFPTRPCHLFNLFFRPLFILILVSTTNSRRCCSNESQVLHAQAANLDGDRDDDDVFSADGGRAPRRLIPRADRARAKTLRACA